MPTSVSLILVAAIAVAVLAVAPRFADRAVRWIALSLALAELAYLIDGHPGWLN